jgi:arylsulfatase A-like enzyme
MFDPDEMAGPIPQAWSSQELPTLESSTVWNDFETAREDAGAMRELRARFHGSLRYLDDQIARLIGAAQQLDRPTVVIFATDHGEMLGNHGLITKAVKHYDDGIRCPLIMTTITPDEPEAAGATRGHVDRELRSSLDFFPTFCDLAGVSVEARPPLEGRSFAPNGDALSRTDSLVGSTGHSTAAGGRGAGHAALCVEFDSVATIITDDNWRLTRYVDDGVTQLFDLSSDPAEQNDRSADPACAERKTAMLEELARLLLQPHRVPQYRAMVTLHGRRIAPNPRKGGARGPAFTDYQLAPPPDFEETP